MAPPPAAAPPTRHVLIAGVSARAAAESAARAGFAVTAIDLFGDLDQHPAVRSLSLRRDFSVTGGPRAAARAAATIACDAVAYLAAFENHPVAVRLLAKGRDLWGNPPSVLARVRDPLRVTAALARRRIAAPAVRRGPRRDEGDVGAVASAGPADRRPRPRRWLVKPLASGGGRRVRPWSRGARVPRGCYLQALVDGTPGSIVFAAAGGGAVPLGVSLQLVGDPSFGAAGYRYCGSILGAAGDPLFGRDASVVDAACAIARAVAADFDLVGVNGIDFVAADGVPSPVEVNPRWSASMELVERAYGVSVFGAHAAACAEGRLPDFDLRRARRRGGAIGKAIVFARRAVTVGDTRAWLGAAGGIVIRDVPHPGEHIAAGAPVCTVIAEARDAAACRSALAGGAARVYTDLAAWQREVA